MGLFDFLKKKELAEINELKKQLHRFKPITDIEKEVANQKSKLQQIINSRNSEIKGAEDKFKALTTEYQTALETYKKLRKEVGVFESKLDLIEFGIYEPVYDFEKSDDYRAEQDKIIEMQKSMISNDDAAICNTNWNVGGSEAKGRALIKVY